MKPIRLASLFSGIGGFELGLLWSIPNLEIIWQVEIDPYCRQVLKKHFSESTQYEDIKTFDTINQIDKNIDILVGGFPCQDISIANSKRSGLDGKKSGLFWEMLRVIKSLRPKIIIMENVAALLIRGGGMGTVLREMDKIGYRVEWFCLEAKDFGLPHKRRRVFIVCYTTDPDSKRLLEHKRQPKTVQQSPVERIQPEKTKDSIVSESTHRINNNATYTTCNRNKTSHRQSFSDNANRTAILQRRSQKQKRTTDTNGASCTTNGVQIRISKRVSIPNIPCATIPTRPEKTPPPEPTICRMDDGFSQKLHNPRLKALGNSIVPQKTEWIGRRLLESGLIRDVLGEEYA